MKKIENSFAISGFVANDATTRKFENNSVARFPISVSRATKEKAANGKTKYDSALLSIEAWKKNDEAADFDIIKKGAHLTVKGYMRPEVYTDKAGVEKSNVVFVATEVFPTPEEEAK